MTAKGENQLDWACRILITIDLLLIVSGYIFYLQTKQQLISPLIPKSTVYQIVNDSHIFEISLIVAIPYLAGLWFYFYKKRVVAIILFSLALLFSKTIYLFYFF
jgi:hypothetical protein